MQFLPLLNSLDQIILDECHKAKNLVPSGSSKPTKTGKTVLELQSALPKARVVYCSATGQYLVLLYTLVLSYTIVLTCNNCVVVYTCVVIYTYFVIYTFVVIYTCVVVYTCVVIRDVRYEKIPVSVYRKKYTGIPVFWPCKKLSFIGSSESWNGRKITKHWTVDTG